MTQPAWLRAGQSRWLKAGLTLAFLIPPVTATAHQATATPSIVRSVLEAPLINQLTVVQISAKYALLAVALACLWRPEWVVTLGQGYYAAVLALIAVGQNVSVTQDYGLVWLPGNTIVQLVVAAFVAADAWTRRAETGPTTDQAWRSDWWVLALIALAWLFPSQVVDGVPAPGLPWHALVNEAGLTYCMVTPVVLGLMILQRGRVSPPALAVTAWVGLLFGVTNAVTWVVLVPGGWWMGVLHLPLLILSGYASWHGRRPRRPRP